MSSASLLGQGVPWTIRLLLLRLLGGPDGSFTINCGGAGLPRVSYILLFQWRSSCGQEGPAAVPAVSPVGWAAQSSAGVAWRPAVFPAFYNWFAAMRGVVHYDVYARSYSVF